jgi:hypothetical protein
MPNDPVNSFPTPPEIKLTDEVAPDLTAESVVLSSPPIIEEVPNSAPEPIEVIAPEPIYAPPPKADQPLAEIPATMPTSIRKPFPIVTALLLLISIGAIAATYFFYQQTKSLNAQLTQITQTMQQQQIKENQTIPQAKPDLAPPDIIPPAPIATPSATGKVFGNIQTVIATAQKQYPTAQLIMIKTESFQDPTLAVIKYWFRQTPTDKRYLYVMAEPNKDLVVVDQQVTVAENTLIPSLNQLAADSQLGVDLPEAVSISSAACPTTFNCAITSISGQYIKSSVTLWQITYSPTNNSQAFVVQIDTTTKKILYKSL